MVYVYCNRVSDGARELTAELGAQRLRNFDGLDFRAKGKIVKLVDPIIVCWGASLPEMEGVKVLNGAKWVNKLKAAALLKQAGVATIQAYDSPPFRLRSIEPSERVEYLARKLDHQGGNDLLNPPARADFYVKKEKILQEYRIHSFGGKSIRAGVRVPREGVPVHPWVRSYDGGWRVSYDGFSSTKAQRDLAAKAVTALGLTFGAVDLAEVEVTGKPAKLIVLEVNRAPGIEGNSVTSYASAVKKWIQNGGTV